MTPWQRSSRRLAVVFLGALVLAALGADVLAPYDPAYQRRDLSFAPPVAPRLIDAEGRFHLRPFVYPRYPAPAVRDGLVEDRTATVPLRFFAAEGELRPNGATTRVRRLVRVELPAHLALLGTDRFGRDQLSRLLHGLRLSLAVGVLAGIAAVWIGVVAGVVAGFWGGWVDAALMRLGELLLTLPVLYLLLAARAFLPLDLGAGEAFAVLVALLVAVAWVRPARLVRGVVLSIRERDYVLAARGFGVSEAGILWRHILPETTGVALTQLALLVPQLLLAEVTLSFLGLGVGEPTPSLGNLLGPLTELRVLRAHAWMAAPALVLVALVAALQSVADGLQERWSTGPSSAGALRRS